MSANTIDPKEPGHTAMEILKLENEQLKLSLIPGMGGKIVSLFRKESGTQFLKQAECDLANYPPPEDGEAFLSPYATGFDECFPTISPSIYKFDGREVKLPDHGELWTQSWNFDYKKNEILLWTHGKRLNYRFVKHIKLSGASVEITYELENLEKVPFDYIWSAHPLLNISSGDEILLPDEISELLVNWSSDKELGTLGNKVTWPKILGNNSNINFNYVQDKSLDLAFKLFSDRLTEGRCGIYKQATNETLVFSFDVEQVPFLGIWLCYGGWPTDNEMQTEYTLALEPCSARPDSLDIACKWGHQQQISSFAIKCWNLGINITKGKSNLLS